jgi:predicted N-acetyltransferase YhbS
MSSNAARLEPVRSKGEFRFRRGTSADYDAVRNLIEAVYGVSRSAESIRWLYDGNPAGVCQFWLAEDEQTGQIASCRPVFPWRMRIGTREFLAAQAGDAMTHPGFQRRGLFGSLVKLAWSELRDQGIPFCFSFSEAGSLSVYKKTTIGEGPLAGTHEVLRFRRMVYPLSLRPYVKQALRMKGLLSALDRATRVLQRLRLRLPERLTIHPVDRFNEEFDDLWARTANQYGVLAIRDSRYLNWKFIDTPGGRFEVVALRCEGALVGYAAFEIDEEGTGCIGDLFGEPRIVRALLQATLAVMLERGCLRAYTWTAAESPLFSMIRRFGFIPRDQPFPMAVHVFHTTDETATAIDPRRWWIGYGDRDVPHLASRPVEKS